ncbi:hypothetical protein [Oleidesulfovibrio alaskensis]
MAKYDCEMFGFFSYSPELSYNELYALEESFRSTLHDALAAHGADYMQYEPEGDALRVQCVFAGCEEEVFHAVCDTVVRSMSGHVHGRLLFVNKNLQELLVYRLQHTGWSEAAVSLLGLDSI